MNKQINEIMNKWPDGWMNEQVSGQITNKLPKKKKPNFSNHFKMIWAPCYPLSSKWETTEN